jgi:HK97 family phage major capsid protein
MPTTIDRPTVYRRADAVAVCGTTQQRDIPIEIRATDDNTRTVELAFSSETPVERYWGIEVLDHSPGAVRLGRLNNGGALLLQHDGDRQIGVVASARVDADRMGRAPVRFSRGALGEEIYQDVRDGIRRLVSTGYIIHDLKPDGERDGVPVYRITDWEPLEISIVSIPADASVGVGRSLTHNPEPAAMADQATATPAEEQRELRTPNTHTETAETRAAPAPAPAQPEIRDTPDQLEMRRIGAHFGLRDLAEDHIMLGTDLASFREMVKKAAVERIQPVPVEPRIEANIPHHAGSLRAFTPEHFGTRKDALEAAYRAGQWAKATIFGDQQAARWCKDYGVNLAKRAMDGSSPGQAAIVPEEMSSVLISLKQQYGLARQVCTVESMMSDTKTVPLDLDDVTAQFVGAGEAADESAPGFGFIQLAAKRLRARTTIDNDYASDSAINLADHVAEKQARAFAIKEDQCLFLGDGTLTYGGIVGILPKLLVHGYVTAGTDRDTFTEVTSADLDAVVAASPQIPGAVYRWYASKRGEALMFGRLRAAQGGSKRDMAERVAKMWDGDDIVMSPVLPAGTGSTDYSGAIMAVYGDLRMGVVFGDRRQMEMMVNPYVLMAEGQTQILSFERIDINVHGCGDSTREAVIWGLKGH